MGLKVKDQQGIIRGFIMTNFIRYVSLLAQMAEWLWRLVQVDQRNSKFSYESMGSNPILRMFFALNFFYRSNSNPVIDVFISCWFAIISQFPASQIRARAKAAHSIPIHRSVFSYPSPTP